MTNPVLKNNTKKYRVELSEQEIKIFESVAGIELNELGYDRGFI